MYRILIVSDNGLLRDMIRLSLADMQAEVLCVQGSLEMENLCSHMFFDVVIVLHTAPFLCGHDLLGTLRPLGPRRPAFYVVSWQQSEQIVLSLLESGVDQYMTFPLSLHRLRSKVANELGRQL